VHVASAAQIIHTYPTLLAPRREDLKDKESVYIRSIRPIHGLFRPTA